MVSQPAACAIDADGGAPDWVQLLPSGEVLASPRDARLPWLVRDAEAIVAASRAIGMDLPIDYEHQTDLSARNGQPAPAAGWIKRLSARADGIFGRVVWTARARAMIEAKEYRFLSPVFDFDRGTREVQRIRRAALTNAPAVLVTAVAKRLDPVDRDQRRVLDMLGLGPTTLDPTTAILPPKRR